MAIRLDGLGTIRFVSVPRGGAPETIRKQWVGVEVPCLYSYNGIQREGEHLSDAVSGLEVPDYPGYIVLQAHALAALEKVAPNAAEYWRQLGYPIHPTALFLFELGSAEVVEPVMNREEFWRRHSDA